MYVGENQNDLKKIYVFLGLKWLRLRNASLYIVNAVIWNRSVGTWITVCTSNFCINARVWRDTYRNKIFLRILDRSLRIYEMKKDIFGIPVFHRAYEGSTTVSYLLFYFFPRGRGEKWMPHIWALS